MRPIDYFPTQEEIELLVLDDFPSETACLQLLWRKKYGGTKGVNCPTCGQIRNFYMMSDRPSYVASYQCRHQVSPLARTVFHKSKTLLTFWFKAIYLIRESAGAIPTTELARQLGITQKTTWRMKDLICKYLGIQKSYSYSFSSAKKPIPPRKSTPKYQPLVNR